MRRVTMLCISALLLMEASPICPASADEELGPRIKVFTEEQPLLRPAESAIVDTAGAVDKSASSDQSGTYDQGATGDKVEPAVGKVNGAGAVDTADMTTDVQKDEAAVGEKTDVPLKAEIPEKAETPEKVETSEKVQTSEKAETSEKTDAAEKTYTADKTDTADKKDADSADESTGKSETASAGTKTLSGYIRVVPLGTKIPIIMDTAIESETSQESDEFTARTSEDLEVDGAVAIPAGSTIKGRISQINPPRHMNRTGSVALKFDTITTPDTRQVPIVANLVAHGGVIHAKRGLRDITIDAATVTVPILLGLGIGYLAGNSNSSTTTTTGTTSSGISKADAAMIGAGIGIVIGVAILCAKKGNKVDVRPGDELKIELAENLRMPTNQ